MNLRVVCVVVGFLLLVLSLAAQTASSNSASAQVPPLIQFSNIATDEGGNTLSGVVSITFSLYTNQQGGEPLWTETQNSVQLDPTGHYSVQLGITKPNGVPTTLFTSGEARWLGVQIAGQGEQPRVLLLSVPYALKAGDAATIGGLPPSAFVLAAPQVGIASAYATEAVTGQSVSPATATDVTTTGGTVNFLPLFNGTSMIVDSVLFQSAVSPFKIGINTATPASTLDVKGAATIRGTLSLPSTGGATATTGADSQPLELGASAFNSGTSKAVTETFLWQAEPTANNTSSPSGTLNLLFSSGTSKPAETGLHVASDGQITFATGQTFPGAGDGTITGVTTASTSGLTGGGTTGTLALGLLKTCATNQVLQWTGTAWACATIAGGGTITGVIAGTDLTGGGSSGNVTLNVNTAKIPQLSAANTFVGNQTVTGNVTASGEVQGGVVNATTSFDIAGTPFAFGSASNENAFFGFAGNSTVMGNFNFAAGQADLELVSTGYSNTVVGSETAFGITTGSDNTAVGTSALIGDSTGYGNTALGSQAAQNTNGLYNTAVGSGALYNDKTGEVNTALGSSAGPDSASTGLYNSTAIGAYAAVSADNSLVLGQTLAGSPGKSFVNVGVGTATPRSILEVSASVTEGLGPTITLTNPGEGVGAATSIDLNSYLPSTTGAYNPAARIEAVDQDNASDAILFQSNVPGKFNNGLQTNMEIYSGGGVAVWGSNAPYESAVSGGPGIIGTGGSINEGTGNGGDGGDFTGGVGLFGGSGLTVTGGYGLPGGDGIDATGGGTVTGSDAYAGNFNGNVNTTGSYLVNGA
jgi:hypothetical protein